MQGITDSVIQYITSFQEPDGSFPTYEAYPVMNPAAGWTKLPDASPFITANILYALMQVNDVRLKAVIDKGINNLLSLKEGAGFWRFSPVKSKQHPIPLDMDDAGIVLFVLARYGYKFGSTAVLINNRDDKGYFKTWLGPKLSDFFISPLTAWGFVQDYFRAAPTRKVQYFNYDDKEPAVAANAILFLGQNDKTQACIAQIIQEVKLNTMPLQFYDDEMVVYYHIARAYANGITLFGDISAIIVERIANRFTTLQGMDDVMLAAMAANTLLYYKIETDLARKIIEGIISTKSYPANWANHTYFCSKNRNFISGAPGLAAALFLEACAKLNIR